MKYFALAAVLLAAAAPSARAQSPLGRCRGLDEPVAALVSQYRELRERYRRAPPGVFDHDLQADGGKFHKVLYSLGTEMGRPPYTKRTIVDCLGAPDAVRHGKQMRPFLDIYERELRKAGRRVEARPGREYLIYHWRGGHDFLFFISEGGRIVDHGWWFAYE